MQERDALIQKLQQIDGRGYKAYRDIRGRYAYPDFTLAVDHVQADPFAPPSRVRLFVSPAVAGFPAALYANKSRQTGLESYLAETVSAACRAASGHAGSGKSGLIAIDTPGQALLKRTAVRVDADGVEVRLGVGLPARGRTVLGRLAAIIFDELLPQIVSETLIYANGDAAKMGRYADVNEDADALRDALAAQGLVAFVADGSVLPRRSGVDQRPLTGEVVVPFQSPSGLRVSFQLPNSGEVRGLGIPRGVTLIVGGGFHGKSTLLNALERGVYNHKPGDGRERVVSLPDTVNIRAEDGRYVAGVDITPFINNLPYGRPTTDFSTLNASGSTSQAANIVEALELGAQVLLIDEDTAATNFMIRDSRMQRLISKENEPITPFIDRVRQLYAEQGVSTILVLGGSGDYFDVADLVIALEDYVPRDVTAEAKAIVQQQPSARRQEASGDFGALAARIPIPSSIDLRKGRRETYVRSQGTRAVHVGRETIDLSAVSQLVDDSQTNALGAALAYALDYAFDGKTALRPALERVLADVERQGLDVLTPYPTGDLAAFRIFELGAAVNRLRTLRVRQAA